MYYVMCVCVQRKLLIVLYMFGQYWSGKCQCQTTMTGEPKTSELELIPGAEVQMYTMCFHGYTNM